MKYITILSFFIFPLFIQAQNVKIKGKYKIEYEQDYASQNGLIKFNGIKYKRKLVNGKTIKGVIVYKEKFVILNEKKNSLQVVFPKEEIEKDTIYFRTKDLNNKSIEGPIIIYSGKLIRIK